MHRTNHRAKRTTDAAPSQAGVPLQSALDSWLVRNCAARGERTRTIPMVFVASQGGGFRSAYWTTSVLTKLLGAPAATADDRQRKAAFSGATAARTLRDVLRGATLRCEGA